PLATFSRLLLFSQISLKAMNGQSTRMGWCTFVENRIRLHFPLTYLHSNSGDRGIRRFIPRNDIRRPPQTGAQGDASRAPYGVDRLGAVEGSGRFGPPGQVDGDRLCQALKRTPSVGLRSQF